MWVIKMTINEILAEKGMTKYKLAKLSGVPHATLNDICSGKTRIEKCSGETLYKLAKALDVSIEDLMKSEMTDRLVEDGIDRSYEYGLPGYLQNDLDAYKDGLKNGSTLLDCLWGELYGSINAAEITDGVITHEHAEYLRQKFLWGETKMNHKKILIDTDIGDDIDDAFAMLFAMCEGVDIVGVTTVFQNTLERARMAKKLLSLYGERYADVPVYFGYGNSTAHTCQYTPDLENDAYAPNGNCPEDAIDFIIECCEKYRDDLIIIAIGPFTNIARAARKSPDALSRVGEVVIMGGAYFRQYADWNVWCDPQAAKTMFESLCGIRCLGADVTHLLRLSGEDDAKILTYGGKNDAASYVKELYRLWKAESRGSLGVLHDPLALLCAIDPTYCRYKSAPVAVVTEGFARGMTVDLDEYGKALLNADYKAFDFGKKQDLACSVDRDAVIERFMRCFDQ